MKFSELLSGAAYSVVGDGAHPIEEAGADELIKFHSAAKPLQAISFLRADYENPYGLTGKERVMLASSHLGRDYHVEALESILRKTGLREADLVVPETDPPGKNAPKRKLCHACAGQHIGFMLTMKERGENPADYYKTDSASQLEAKRSVEHFCRREADPLALTPDNCGVPTYWVTLRDIAEGYRNYALFEPDAVFLLREYAEYVEGEGSLATELMRRYPVTAKTAVNMLVGIGIPNKGFGIALKADSWEALADAAGRVLSALY